MTVILAARFTYFVGQFTKFILELDASDWRMRLGATISLHADWLGNDLLIIFGFMQACNVVKVAVDLQINSGKIRK